MLTRLTVRRFKSLGDVEIELGNPVVFIGPNNAGKTNALQAIALWHLGLNRWLEKRGTERAPEKRPGVSINRRDLTESLVPDAKHLWHNLHVRNVTQSSGKTRTSNVRIEIIVEGVLGDRAWTCGLEFDYANDESFYCRPLRSGSGKNQQRMPIPKECESLDVAFLQPMSGLAREEPRHDPGWIKVLLGEGRTAEVLRNLCFRVIERENGDAAWERLCARICQMFGAELDRPEYIAERGELKLTYRGESNTKLDISSAGRGQQQVILLLAHLVVNPRSVLLLDEPDAHLEILRQRQIYQTLTEAALEQGSQIIAASHSEVMLNEAADRDVVVAFVGKTPHRIDDRGNQLLKSLRDIGFEQYYQAEQTGWVLYLEGSTDLAILRAFATRLHHPVEEHLQRPFVYYIENHLERARNHFFGLCEAKKDLVGYVVCDRGAGTTQDHENLIEYTWERREIENYLCQPETLERWARSGDPDVGAEGLFDAPVRERTIKAVQQAVKDLVPPVALRDREDKWWRDVKASNEFLDRVFERVYSQLEWLPNLMRKTNYHRLAKYVPEEMIDPEVVSVLDNILQVARRAKPVR